VVLVEDNTLHTVEVFLLVVYSEGLWELMSELEKLDSIKRSAGSCDGHSVEEAKDTS